jgi:hypothetical protein
MSSETIYELLSERYGWLPSQIRNEKADDILSYLEVIDARAYIDKVETKKLKYGNRY